jgi:hypothetical protein
MNLTEYNLEVKRAKSLVKRRAEHKDEIIKIALRVCTIKHGGHNDSVYSIRKFGADIGMNGKTLNHWILEFKDVTSKVPKDLRVPKDSDIIRRVRATVGKNATKKTVIASYKQEASYPPEEQEMLRHIRHNGSYLFFLRSHALKLLSPSSIEKCREIHADTLEELISIQISIGEQLNG